METQISVIADDLSGANTAAALFHKMGWQAIVHVDIGTLRFAETLRTVHVWNAGTRNIAGERAASFFVTLAHKFTGLVAFRIDSTLRGPIMPSLDALLDAWPTRVAFVVPAYPDSGRVTKGGIHYVGDIPVHETEVGHDPICPVHSSDICDWLGTRSRHPFIHLSLETLRSTGVWEWLNQRLLAGGRIVLCDACSNADITALAELATRCNATGQPVIPVDPGPFTAAFSSLASAQQNPFLPTVLGISASVMHNARGQMDYLEHTVGVPMVHYTGQPVAEVVQAFKRMIKELTLVSAAQLYASGPTIFLRTDTWQLDASSASSAVQQLAQIVWETVLAFPSLAGFYFSGGEAATTILSGLGVHTLQMQMEIAPLTTMTKVLDGQLKGKFVVTKGGTIGKETAALDALLKLHEAVVRQ